MKRFYFIIALLMFVSNYALTQSFNNPGLNGNIVYSQAPSGWQMVPYTDPVSQATPISGFDSPDIVGITGPSIWDIVGQPFEGVSYASGLFLTFTDQNGVVVTWHEGIMQNLSGLTPGQNYSISFHQTVDMQNDCRDETGGWKVYADNTLIGTTAITNSASAPFVNFDTTQIWELRTVTFTATSTSHLIKFMPYDDDNDQEGSDTNTQGGLRMGIDDIVVECQPFNVNLGNDTTYCGTTPFVLSTGFPGLEHIWNDGSTNDSFIVSTSGTYFVQVTNPNGGCTASDTIQIVIDSVTADFTDSISGCAPVSANFIGNSSSTIQSWTWDFGDGTNGNAQNTSHVYTNSGTYNVTLTVTKANGCSQTITKTNYVEVFDVPIVNLGNDIVACKGDTVILDAQNSSASYLWSDNSTSQTLSANNSGVYWVEVTANSCSNRDTIQLLFNEPIVDFTQTASGCSPLTATFDALTLNGIIAWNWDFGNGNLGNGENTSTTYYAEGLYDVTLTVTDNVGCSASLTKPDFIEVFPQPVTVIDYTPSVGILANTDINFFTNLENGESAQWFFDNGDVFNDADFYYNFDAEGNYSVELFVQNQFGCIDSVTSIVEVTSPSIIYLPNSFTPDGDEYNNVFKAKGEGITDFEMQIYNRWGELLFESHDINVGWDGTYQGKLMQSGTYVWKVVYNLDFSPEKKVIHGHLNILK